MRWRHQMSRLLKADSIEMEKVVSWELIFGDQMTSWILLIFILVTYLLCDNFALINNAGYEYILKIGW